MIPDKLTIYLFYLLIVDRYLIFMDISDMQLWPYYESIRWWGVYVQVCQDIIWKKNCNCFVYSLTCLSSWKWDWKSPYTSIRITIFFNVLTIDSIAALHAKRLSSSSNGEALIFLRTSSGMFSTPPSYFSTINNSFGKYYVTRAIQHGRITVDIINFEKPWHDMIFIRISGIPNPEKLMNFFSNLFS